MDGAAVVSKLADLDPGFRQVCEALYPGLNPAEVYDAVYKANGVVKPPMSTGKKVAVGTATTVGTLGALAVHPKVFDAAAMKLPHIGALDRGITSALRVARVAKSEPSSADVHVPTTAWRNGRGHTKGRGRRKIDNTVKETRYVNKKVDRDKLEHGIGLGTTAIGSGISAVALPKHLSHLPTAMRTARTSAEPMSAGIKNAVSAVRQYSKPAKVASGALSGAEATPKGIKTGLGALRAGVNVARENPRISAGLAVGAAALHTANLGGEAIATHVLAGQRKKPKVEVGKAWTQAQEMIVRAHAEGRISKAEALAYAASVRSHLAAAGALQRPVRLSQLTKSAATVRPVHKADYGYASTSGTIKLATLKAPPLVKPDGPHLSPSSVNQPKAATSGAGRKSGGTKASGKKTSVGSGKNGKSGLSKQEFDAPEPAEIQPEDTQLDIDVRGEIRKLDEDRQQCFGWCSVVKIDGKDVVDKQGDIIDIDEVERAAYEYMMSSRAGGDMHRRADDGSVHKVAEVIESFVVTPEKRDVMGMPDNTPLGWWIGMHVTDADTWSQVKKGERSGFSIHGVGKRTEELVMDA
jgi:hypothetical protein